MKGQCWCGQLRYTLNEDPVFSCYCHCHACQRMSGGPCVGFVMARKGALDVEGESASFQSTGGSGRPILQHHCTRCSAAVYYEPQVLDRVVAITASTLNNVEDFQPEAHIWVSSQNPRFEIQDGLPQKQGPPRELAAFVVR